MFDVKGREFWTVVLGWPIKNAILPSVHGGFESLSWKITQWRFFCPSLLFPGVSGGAV